MLEKKASFKLVGLMLKNKTTNHDYNSIKDCGELWVKFEKDKIFESIPGKLSNEVYAVYFDYVKNDAHTFSYFIGCKVATNFKTPARLDGLIIPKQLYKIYTAKGVMTACVTETWKQIWNTNFVRKFTYDFEIYDERSKDWSNAEVDIYVAIID